MGITVHVISPLHHLLEPTLQNQKIAESHVAQLASLLSFLYFTFLGNLSVLIYL